ncbi:hypothetical protein [Geobacillus sp. C56-T3]|uniref:hypothetical protein n=1 Tax=Geobacillus sp. (strain C56-T3) TaxID=691437 RepID=UPI0002EF39D3|nr:hypothetical protein [Geobacillus sp. C56-T3]
MLPKTNEQGFFEIRFESEAKGRRVPLSEWLKCMGKTKHLLRKENEDLLRELEEEVERRWTILKAKHEHPYLLRMIAARCVRAVFLRFPAGGVIWLTTVKTPPTV